VVVKYNILLCLSMGCVEINMLPFSPPFLPLLLSGFILALPSLDLCLTGVFGLVVATSLCHFITATNQSAFFRRSRPFQTFFFFLFVFCFVALHLHSICFLFSNLFLFSFLTSPKHNQSSPNSTQQSIIVQTTNAATPAFR
jgi:hypothetical protein